MKIIYVSELPKNHEDGIIYLIKDGNAFRQFIYAGKWIECCELLKQTLKDVLNQVNNKNTLLNTLEKLKDFKGKIEIQSDHESIEFFTDDCNSEVLEFIEKHKNDEIKNVENLMLTCNPPINVLLIHTKKQKIKNFGVEE